jgi:Rrf2 family iron-sulfur cluster assembly transcriptional regulator
MRNKINDQRDIMRLTAKSRYAVTALLDLAIHTQNTRVTLADIADRQVISLSYLEQLFSRLRKAGFVKGIRGPGGGYMLAKSVNDITIADIIESVNEPISATACEGRENCFNGEICLVHDLWADLDQEIESYLSKITLADEIVQLSTARNRQVTESVVTFTKCVKL